MTYVKALTAVGLLGLATCLVTTSVNGAGADVILSGIDNDVDTFGPVGGIYAYTIGSDTCNIGDTNLAWNNNGTPGLAMNAYRLHNGRLQQIGVGMIKTACCAAQSPGCGVPTCTPGSGLGPGCKDTYWAGWNAGQSRLKPRKNVNPYTGAYFSTTGVSSGSVLNGRIQVQQADMNPATYPGALYFMEGQYICTEDAVNGNWGNNASYTRVTIDGAYQGAPAGAVAVSKPAIWAWRDHGVAIGVPDFTVTIQNVDVPGEGRFLVGSKVTQTGRNTWHYEYAIQNFNSDRCASSFRLPLLNGATVTNSGFSDVWYHGDDAIYDGTNWPAVNSGFELRWSTTQTYAQNPNANAIRWGTMYNFWFDSNVGPVQGQAEIDLFKPATGCQPVTVSFPLSVPGVYCDADISRNGAVDADDLLAVISGWGACPCPVNCPANIEKTGNNTSVDADDLLKIISGWGGCI